MFKHIRISYLLLFELSIEANTVFNIVAYIEFVADILSLSTKICIY
jgi:hypothetical protein